VRSGRFIFFFPVTPFLANHARVIRAMNQNLAGKLFHRVSRNDSSKRKMQKARLR
jgi:hypothetical protein